MSAYYEFVKNHLGVDACNNINKYSDAGYTFHINTKEICGYYWFYETEQFIVDIHDFFTKQEAVSARTLDIRKFMAFCSSYIITGNGESFSPYQNLSTDSLYVADAENINEDYKIVLHGNFPYLSVGFYFKKEMIEAYLSSIKNKECINYSDLFLNKDSAIVKALRPLAMDVLNCKMKSPAAEIFFEAKAKEWISLIVDSFLNKNKLRVSKNDVKALKDVADYLDDHYAISVSQSTLEKISMMSGTKLKKLFKQEYSLSITEYTQRKRMNIAELLLLNSSLSIKDVAKSVGYSSHSKFSLYFKKYKGILPKDLIKLSKDSTSSFAHSCACDDCHKKI